MRDYFFGFLSATINAINIPKDIINVSVLTMSIGITSLLENFKGNFQKDQQCTKILSCE